MEIEERVVRYWTRRSRDFGAVRQNELGSAMGRRWLAELQTHLPQGRPLEVLDVGTGTGFFAVLLAEQGCRVTGIDLTPAMLAEAEALTARRGLAVTFRQMDAQNLQFADGSFDAVVSRNLTWTLPDPARAYAEWHRVLRPGGVLLNFDADYAENVRSASAQNRAVSPDSPYGHLGMTADLEAENDAITLELDIGQARPDWDAAVLRGLGFQRCQTDKTAGRRILGGYDLPTAPMFAVVAVK